MVPLFPLLICNLFLLSTVAFFFYSFILGRNKARQPNSLPSPPKLPLIGNLHQLGSLPHRSLRALSEKYGPLMLIHFGHVPTIIVSSTEMAQEVMKTHDLVFASRPPSSIANKLLYDSQDVAFSPYGEYWRQVRKVCVLHLLSLKRVQSFRSVRHEEVTLMVQKIRASPGMVNLSEMLITLTNDIICRVAFGRKYSEGEGGSNRVRERLTEFVVLLGEFPVGDFIPCLSWLDSLSGLNARLRKNFCELDAFIDMVLENHLQTKKRSHGGQEDTVDFADVLLSLDAKDDTAGISLSRDNIKAISLDMFAAGTDTTFAALEWTMAELIRHPEAMKRVQEEIRGIAGLKENIAEEDMDQMNYLKAVIKEALRLHPPVPLLVPRESLEDIQLQGYDIPSRTRIMINAWAIGRDPRYWERPEEFLPDRFMNNSVDFRGHDFQLIPFGAGRRGCPGIAFAISTIELALANLLHCFDWMLPDGKKERDFDMSEISGITVHKKSNLILVAKRPF